MLLSLLPYCILQTIYIFNTPSSGSRKIILVAFVVSTLLLAQHTSYQILNPWIQERSLQYSKKA
ncbi:hypothetical protein Leryth_022350 [Lithospermum erythrorhizon]|nr:hypothetical protein Leryth_022350 [Lithospermum erythrorhizon]